VSTNQTAEQPEDQAEQKNVVERVARRSRRPDQDIVETTQLVTFELDQEEYASHITDLREIITVSEVVPVPGAPRFIRGILNLRGQIVVVIDLEERFQLQREHHTPPKHIVVVEVGENVFGLIVDEVTGVLRVPTSTIKDAPQLISTKIHSEYLAGVVVLEDEPRTNKKQKPLHTKEDGHIVVEEEVLAQVGNGARLILLLDVPKLLSEGELMQFGEVVRQTAQEAEQEAAA
jgi:purine-binding chemotaxis protein CheW